MSRILRHVGNKDFKRTRQRQIGEQKECAAKKLKEWQEAEAERKQIEEIARPFKSDWREETQLQESDWTTVSVPLPTNSTSQTFEYPGGSRVTVSGLGGVETTPSTVTVNQFGDVFDVPGPNYSQLGLQGYAPPLGNVNRRRDYEDVNPRLDASQEFARNVNSDVFMNARPPALRDYMNVSLDDVAKDHGVKDAKDVFDYYMNWAENPNSNPVNLTNKISPEGQAYLQKLSGDPSVQGLTGMRKAEALNQLYVRDLNNGSIPRGLRNILGMPDRNKGDGFNVDKNGKVTVSKAYDFTNITDIGGTDITTGLAAGLYAAGQGIMKHFDGGKESPTMNININVAAPSANANSLGQRGPDGGMTDAQIKAAQDKVNADRKAGKMSDIRGSEANRPYTFDKETGEPKYTGMDDQQLNDAYNKISDKYNDLRAPLEKQLRDLAGQEAPQSIVDKINQLNDAQTAEEEALRAEREAQENEFNDALKDYFDKQDAENKERQDALDEIDNEKDPYSDLLGRLGAELEKLRREGKLIKGYKIIGPGEEGYVDTTNMANAIGYNRRPIYTARAEELLGQLGAAQDAQVAWINAQQKRRDAAEKADYKGGQGGLPIGTTTLRGGAGSSAGARKPTPPENMSQSAALARQAASARMNPQQRRKKGMKESTTWSRLKKHR